MINDILNFIAMHYIVSIILIWMILDYIGELVLGTLRSFTGNYPPAKIEIEGHGNIINVPKQN